MVKKPLRVIPGFRIKARFNDAVSPVNATGLPPEGRIAG